MSSDCGGESVSPAQTAEASVSGSIPTAATALDSLPIVLPNETTHDLVLCCRRCRQPLLRPANITAHERGQQGFSYRRQAKERERLGGAPTEEVEADESGAAGGDCTSYFLDEPLQWMRDASSDVEGKLNCPKCSTRVGVLKWAGAQCSCEWEAAASRHVTMPCCTWDKRAACEHARVREVPTGLRYYYDQRHCRRHVGQSCPPDIQEGCRRALVCEGPGVAARWL